MPRSIRILALLGCQVLSGCFSYATVDPRTVSPGQAVSVRVTHEGTRRVTEILGDGWDARTFQGVVQDSKGNDSIPLSVVLTPLTGSSARRPLRAVVPIPVAEIEELGVRRLDRARTSALVAASALLAVVVVNSQFGGSEEGRDADDQGGIDQAMVTLFRFRW